MGVLRVEMLDEYIRLQAPMNDHQVRAVIWLRGHLDLERLRSCVNSTLESVPVLACRYATRDGRAVWDVDTDYTEADYFTVVSEQLTPLGLTDHLRKIPDQERGPQIRVTVVRQQDDDVVIVTVNHMAFDGTGLKSYLYLLSSLYSSHGVGAAKPSAPLCLDRRMSTLLKNVSMRRELASLLRPSPARGETAGPLADDENATSVRLGLLRFSGDRYRALRSYGRVHDLTVNDLVLALLCQALRECDPASPPSPGLTVQMMVDLRRYAGRHPVSDYGNFSSMESIRDAGPSAGLLEVATAVRSQTMLAKRGDPGIKNILVLTMLSRLLPRNAFARVLAGAIRSFGVSTSNLGVLDESRLVFQGVDIEKVCLLTSIKRQPAIQLSFSTFRDEMSLSVLGEYSDANWTSVRRILARVAATARAEFT